MKKSGVFRWPVSVSDYFLLSAGAELYGHTIIKQAASPVC